MAATDAAQQQAAAASPSSASMRKAKVFDKFKRALCFTAPDDRLESPVEPEPTTPGEEPNPAGQPQPPQQHQLQPPAQHSCEGRTDSEPPNSASDIHLQAYAGLSPPKQRAPDTKTIEFTPPASRRLPAKTGEILSLHPLEHPGPSSTSAITTTSDDQPPASNQGPGTLRTQLSSPAFTGFGASAPVADTRRPAPATADGGGAVTTDHHCSRSTAASRSSCGSRAEPGSRRAQAHSTVGSVTRPQLGHTPDKPRGPKNFSWPLGAVILESDTAIADAEDEDAAPARPHRQTDSARNMAVGPRRSRNARNAAAAAAAAAGGGHLGSAASLPSPKGYNPHGKHAYGLPDMSLDELVDATHGHNAAAAGGGGAKRRVSGLQNFSIMAQQLYADGRSLGEARANLRKHTRTMLECQDV